MKKILLVSAALMLAHVAFPQGQVNFNNRANPAGTPGTSPGVVVAPFYNLDPNNPNTYKEGNTATGNPAGSQTYAGPLLLNDATHNYTVTLWARKSTDVTGTADLGNNNLNLVGTTTMNTTAGSTRSGYMLASASNPVVPDVAPNGTERATFQVRVWDSRGGTIATWAQALATPGEILSYSRIFTVPFPLTAVGDINAAPNLEGLQSFQLFIVPEPSVIALGVLGAGCLFLLRRRK